MRSEYYTVEMKFLFCCMITFFITVHTDAEPVHDKAKLPHVLAKECAEGNHSACEINRKARAWELRIQEYQRKHIHLQNRISMESRFVPDNISETINRPWFQEVIFNPNSLELVPNTVVTPEISKIIEEANFHREQLKKIPIIVYCEWDLHCRSQHIGYNRCGKHLGSYYYSIIAGLPDVIKETIKQDRYIFLLKEHLKETQDCKELMRIQPVCKNFICSAP